MGALSQCSWSRARARLQRIGKHGIGDHSWQLSDAVGWQRGQSCFSSRICAGGFRLWLRVAAQAAARYTEPPGAWLKPRPEPTGLGLGLVVPQRRRASLPPQSSRRRSRSRRSPPLSPLQSVASPFVAARPCQRFVAAFIDVAIVVVAALVDVVIVAAAAAIVALPFSHSRPLSGTSRRCSGTSRRCSGTTRVGLQRGKHPLL